MGILTQLHSLKIYFRNRLNRDMSGMSFNGFYAPYLVVMNSLPTTCLISFCYHLNMYEKVNLGGHLSTQFVSNS